MKSFGTVIIPLIAMLYVPAFALADTIKIGVVLPLSGGLAEYGIAARNGIELARKDHPEALKDFEFIFEDSQYDGKKALFAVQSFISAGDVKMAYLWGYGPSQAVASIAEQQKFPLIAVSAEPSVAAGKKYVVRFCYRIEMIADVLIQYLRAKGLKRIGVFNTDIAYTNGLIEKIKRGLNPDESLEVVGTFQPADTTFKPAILKSKSKNFDALAVLLIGGQIGNFYKELRVLHVSTPTVGTDFFDSMVEVKNAQGTMTGAIFGAPYVSDDFVARYVRAFGNGAQAPWAANSFEFALLAAELFGENRSVTPDQLVESIKRRSDERGTAGRYRYNPSPGIEGVDFRTVIKRVLSDRIIEEKL